MVGLWPVLSTGYGTRHPAVHYKCGLKFAGLSQLFAPPFIICPHPTRVRLNDPTLSACMGPAGALLDQMKRWVELLPWHCQQC